MIQFGKDESHIRMMVKRDELSYRIDMHLKKNKAKEMCIRDRSSPTDSPRILPRFSYAFIRSIEKKSSGIPISILFLTRSRLLSASSNAAL